LIAARTRLYVPHLQMLVIDSLICASLGLGVSLSNAAAAMIMPDWQYPHCGTSSATQAFCTGCEPFGESPSMVTIFSVALTVDAGRMQLRVATPSMCTVQAPH